ncbi:protein adenylyltransferase SelO [Atopomonas sediminilitoris]|uniref:protein adenylyltransferase SelO n=1 Tax=Atopomonas sediminilitoris TaxID=2919919 RepID=UPI001F4E841B|nr:YdiU family protein [Atopomonas sediminilitoris]MCJ8170358.1 YdiU family protein [Atopomonas sediminilitoris]
MSAWAALSFDNHFARLDPAFYTRLEPTPLSEPRLAIASASALALLDLPANTVDDPALVTVCAGQQRWAGSDPLAMLYAGHQFGGYNPQLGDGRGLLLGQVRNRRGESWDLHLKGAGLTPYSRMGDGRAVLRSSIREFLASEYLAALNIPTTRALAVVSSNTRVQREHLERGATLMRLAPSHLRFGHFEIFYYRQQFDLLRQLADYALQQHFADCLTDPQPYAALYRSVVERTAGLIAHWQAYGFCHGVMNTDNMALCGQTFDFGPYAFLDDYEPGYICNASDDHGRYAFNRQVDIAQWNLAALAQALTPLVAVEQLREIHALFAPLQQAHFQHLMRQRLGLTCERDGDDTLVVDWLALLTRSRADFHLSHRRLSDTPCEQLQQVADDFADLVGARTWLSTYHARLQHETRSDAERQQAMRAVNPLYVLRNHLAQEAITAAEHDDFAPLRRLHEVLSQPFTAQTNCADLAAPPAEALKRMHISCSS